MIIKLNSSYLINHCDLPTCSLHLVCFGIWLKLITYINSKNPIKQYNYNWIAAIKVLTIVIVYKISFFFFNYNSSWNTKYQERKFLKRYYGRLVGGNQKRESKYKIYFPSICFIWKNLISFIYFFLMGLSQINET